MRSTEAVVALTLAVGIASCSGDGKNEGKRVAAATGPAVAETIAAAPAGVVPAPSTTQAARPSASGSGALPLPTAADARQVVVAYYAAIDSRDYRKAYGLWGEGGEASGQSFEHFSGGYANTESVEADVGEATDEEGAAGSRYITVPVQLRARQYNGTLRSYRGRFALRAVVADGASGEQRRWHLDSAEMQRLP